MEPQEAGKHQNVTSSDALVTSSFLFLVVRPGAPSSVLAPSSDALVTSSFLFLVVRPGAPSSVLRPSSDALVTSSFLLLVVMHLLLVTGRMRKMIRVFSSQFPPLVYPAFVLHGSDSAGA